MGQRGSAGRGSSGGQGQQEPDAPPNIALLKAVVARLPQVQGSIHECKAGIKPAKISAINDIVNKVSGLPGVKQVLKRTKTDCASNSWGCLPLNGQDPKTRKVVRECKNGLDNLNFTCFNLPSVEWAPKVHAMELFGFQIFASNS